MKIDVIAVGKIKETYLKDGIAEFTKRLKPYIKLSIIECPEEKIPENFSDADKNRVLEKEGEKLLQFVKNQDSIIVLDLKGKQMSSEDLADFFVQKALSGKSHIAILIGGAYGLSDKVKEKADLLLSFSKFTFTHQMIRFFLIEQIYRAFKIINKEKYHN